MQHKKDPGAGDAGAKDHSSEVRTRPEDTAEVAQSPQADDERVDKIAEDLQSAREAAEAEHRREQADALYSPLNGAKIHITFFRNKYAKDFITTDATLSGLKDLILESSAATKEGLPWLKLATFGTKRSDKNSLRNEANVVSISGVELDYDGKQISFASAVETLKRARLRALIYSSPSYAEAAPKWRVLCPTSADLPPSERAKLAARVNGLFGGIFAGESFTLSQSYFYGRINGRPAPLVEIVEGDFVDLRDDLDDAPVGPNLGDAFGEHSYKEPVDVEASLAAMRYEDATGHGIHLTQLSCTAALMNRGEDIEVVARACWRRPRR